MGPPAIAESKHLLPGRPGSRSPYFPTALRDTLSPKLVSEELWMGES